MYENLFGDPPFLGPTFSTSVLNISSQPYILITLMNNTISCIILTRLSVRGAAFSLKKSSILISTQAVELMILYLT